MSEHLELPKGFHWLTVSDVRKETDSSTSVAFSVPDDLHETFAFRPGQYLTLLRPGEGAVRRPYSICASPLDGELRVCVKQLAGGEMSTFVNTQLRIGDKLAVRQPTGRFCLNEKETGQGHFVFIAAGSGITPVLSHLRTLLYHEGSTATLIYGNSGRSQIIFRESLSALKNSHLGRLSVHHVLSRDRADAPLFEGRLERDKIVQLLSSLVDLPATKKFLICGPAPVMDNAVAALTQLGVENDRILVESFGSHTPLVAPPLPESVSSDAVAETRLTIHGEETVLRVPYDRPVLDIALEAGLDIPFACKGGVCCTCKARLVEGEVVMPVNYGLEPDEIERGFILTCQAIPRTEKLVVDYDAV